MTFHHKCKRQQNLCADLQCSETEHHKPRHENEFNQKSNSTSWQSVPEIRSIRLQ